MPRDQIRLRPSLLAATAVGAVGVLAAEAAWVVRRDLPSLVGLDASAEVPGEGPLADRAVRVVALGDSTLTGPGLADASDIWVRRAIADLASRPTVDLRSLAVGGSRAADVAGRIDDALELEPDAVVVAVGSNDAIHGTPPRRFVAELEAIASRLTERVGAVGICNIGDLGNLARVPRPLSDLLRARSHVVRRQIERTVARHDGVVLLDVTGSNRGLRDRSMYGDDLFHPSAEGHALWAEAARPGLAQVLARAAQPAEAP